MHKPIVFTQHARERLNERDCTEEQVVETILHPDKVIAGKEKNTAEYQKQFADVCIFAVASQNALGEWVVLSCWRNPPADTSSY